jgi:hypothetical protein
MTLRALRRSAFAFVLGAGAWVISGPCPAATATTLSQSEQKVFNFAFATQLGSGVYDVNGRTLQVYRLPFAYTVRPVEGNPWGLRLNFPLTLGFYDFKAADVLESGLPSNVGTLSLVAGAEFLVPAAKNWLIKPLLEAGVGKEKSGSADTYVFTGGVSSLADFRAGRFDLNLGNKLAYTRLEVSASDKSDAIVFLETSLQARHTMGFSIKDHEVDYAMYGVQDLIVDRSSYPFEQGNGLYVDDQYEVGVTFGAREPFRLWKITLPRVGFGYRFGGGLSVFRLVLGTAAPSQDR